MSSRTQRTSKPPAMIDSLTGEAWVSFGQADGRAQVGEEAEMLAQRQQRGALGLLVRRQRFPFRSADGAEENRVRLAADAQRLRRQRLAVDIDGGAADARFRESKVEAEFRLDRGEHAARFGHDFGADAVAGRELRF